MVKRGGLELAMPEAVWEHMFKEPEEQKKAETILQTLDGMSIASAKGTAHQVRAVFRNADYPFLRMSASSSEMSS